MWTWGPMGGDTPGFTGPLDPYTTDVWCAVSVDRLFTSWLGQSLTATRTSDNSIQDIGFLSNGAFDAAALSAFLGSSDGVVQEWVNQQGVANRSFTQATVSQQPRIATTGTFEGRTVFDGTDDFMLTGALSGTPNAFTVFLRGALDTSTAGPKILLEHTQNYNNANAAIAYWEPPSFTVSVHGASPAGYGRSDFTGDYPYDNVQCYRFDRQAVTSATMSVLFIDGVKETRNADGSTGTLPTGAFSLGAWRLGGREPISGNTPLFPANLAVHTLIIYERALSDADIASISTIIAGLP